MSKKLIYLTHARIPSEKTPSPFILKTCAGFVHEGWDVELWAARRHNPWFAGVDPFREAGVPPSFPIKMIPVVDWMRGVGRAGFVFMIVAYNVAVAFRLWRRRHEPGLVVYAHDLRDIILPLFIGIPVVCEIHDFFESSVEFVNRVVLPRVQGLVVTNSIKAKILREKYGIAPTRLLIQPNAVSVEEFDISTSRAEAREYIGLPQDTRIIMYTGHLYEWKGVYTLAASAEFFPNDVYLYFVGGTSSDRNLLQRFVEEKRLSHIVFIDHQPHDMIPLYLRAADVVVLPNTAKEAVSREETSPVKLFEYLASGTPIVASDLPSVREIVTEGEVIFVQPDDPREMARAIETALQGDAAYRSAQGVALARQHSWHARARSISDFLMR